MPGWTQNEKKRGGKRKTEESAAVSLRSTWHLQQNTGRMEWWKVEGRMKAKATALKEWNITLKEAQQGANSTEEQRQGSWTDCYKNETQHPWDISTFSDKSPQNANFGFLFFFFGRIPGSVTRLKCCQQVNKLNCIIADNVLSLCTFIFAWVGIKIKEIVNPKIASAHLSFEDKQNIHTWHRQILWLITIKLLILKYMLLY